ncbi:hypothetical protein [Pontibacter rugosus]|uniref:Uncharacterized protein n=1 Tax=Pontibacter rugosus TaxID=1745966 RepID=A0ABW3SLV3_9BACT
MAFNRAYINGAFAAYADLKEVQPNIFVAPDLDQKTADSLILVVQQAKLRNEKFWQEPVALPKIIYCSSPKMAKKYIMVKGTHAESIFTIFSCHIVINRTGLNVDIVSHELAHVALFDRIKQFKWIIVTYKLPVWFDEGACHAVRLQKRLLHFRLPEAHRQRPQST